jgi:hypothetical protein
MRLCSVWERHPAVTAGPPILIGFDFSGVGHYDPGKFDLTWADGDIAFWAAVEESEFMTAYGTALVKIGDADYESLRQQYNSLVQDHNALVARYNRTLDAARTLVALPGARAVSAPETRVRASR